MHVRTAKLVRFSLFLDFFYDLRGKKQRTTRTCLPLYPVIGVVSLAEKKARWAVWKKKKKIEHGLFADCLIKPPVG